LRVGSSDLTPEVLAQMQEQHCVANAAGIGTKLVHTNPFGAVYKLSQIDGPNGARFACKFSSKGKVGNLPGSHQIWRAYDADGHAIRDTVALLDEEIPGATPIMRPYMREGMLLAPYLSKEQLRAQFEEGRKGLPASSPYPVLLSERAEQLRAEVIEGIREREITPFLPQLAQYFTRAELEGVLPEDEIDIIFGGE